jgi:hypothetical protein
LIDVFFASHLLNPESLGDPTHRHRVPGLI